MEEMLAAILRCSFIVLIISLCLGLAGCAGAPFFGRSDTRIEHATEEADQRDSRTQASLQLTEQGRALLEQGRLDDAVSMLERSIGLDPTNGQSYYYLSDAWLLKGNIPQAQEFNRLAGLYLQNDRTWSKRVTDQRDRIMAIRIQQGK